MTILSPQRRKERKVNPDNKKKRFMSFETWIADTDDKGKLRTLQVFLPAIASVFLCVLCVFAVKR
jgi:hypothetical protein